MTKTNMFIVGTAVFVSLFIPKFVKAQPLDEPLRGREIIGLVRDSVSDAFGLVEKCKTYIREIKKPLSIRVVFKIGNGNSTNSCSDSIKYFEDKYYDVEKHEVALVKLKKIVDKIDNLEFEMMQGGLEKDTACVEELKSMRRDFSVRLQQIVTSLEKIYDEVRFVDGKLSGTQ